MTLREALEFCIETMDENDEYGWIEDFKKVAERLKEEFNMRQGKSHAA